MKKTIISSFIISQTIYFALFPVWLNLANYLHPLVLGVVWFCLTFLILFVVCLSRSVQITLPIRPLHFVMLGYTIGLLVLLFLRPGGSSYGQVNLIPFETIVFYFSGQVSFLISFYNIAANIGLFVPFGVYYQYVKRTSGLIKLLLLSTAAICTIEGLQFLTKRGSLDVDDLILNVIGVALGYLFFPFLKKVFHFQR